MLDHFRSSFLAACFVGLTVSAAQAQPGECKRKTAGFFLQYADISISRSIAIDAPGIEVSLTGALGDPNRGRDILVSQEKGDCLSCHKLSAADMPMPGQGEVGPSLDRVGSRYTEAQLRQFVVNPRAYIPDIIMPSYHKLPNEGGPEGSILTASEVEDLVAYMKSLK